MAGEDNDEKLTRSERIVLRVSVIQTALAVTGFFVACIALYAALSQADAARKQVEASVWPSVQITSSNFDLKTQKRVFRVTGANSGIGPARIMSVRVTVDGKPQKDWYSAFRAINGLKTFPLINSYMTGRVLRAGEAVDFASVSGEAGELINEKLHDIANSSQLTLEVCYCSVFDQCWLTGDKHEEIINPKPVAQCPDYGNEKFEE